MKQRSYKYQIITLLLKDKAHVRSLARQLNTNPMRVSRDLKELQSENVVDYREEGKNKTYFLKDTPEAKTTLLLSEGIKLKETLAKYPSLRAVIEAIHKDRRIRLALIFGSFAKRTAKKDSDIDLFIESEDFSLKKELSLLDSRLSIKLGELNNSPLASEIRGHHVIIKGVEAYYEENPVPKQA